MANIMLKNNYHSPKIAIILFVYSLIIYPDESSSLELFGRHSINYSMLIENDKDSSGKTIHGFNYYFEEEVGFKYLFNSISIYSNWICISKMKMLKDISLDFISPLENYLKWQNNIVTLGIGLQKHVWGSADGLSPTNNVSPVDLRNPFRPEILSVFSMSIDYQPIQQLLCELILIPVDQSYIYPANMNYTEEDEKINIINKEIPMSIGNMVEGIRIQFFTPSFDISLSYLNDYDHFYTPEIILYPEVNSNDETVYSIEKVYMTKNRINRFGGDLKTCIGKVSLLTEVCFNMTEDRNNRSYKIKNNSLNWVSGIDFNYGLYEQNRINIQMNGQWVPGYYKTYKGNSFNKPNRDSLNNYHYMEKIYYTNIVDRAGNYLEELLLCPSVEAQWSFNYGKIKPYLNVVGYISKNYPFNNLKRYYGAMINVNFDWNPFQSLHLIIGTQIFKVNDINNPLNYLSKYNNVFIEMNLKWDKEIN